MRHFCLISPVMLFQEVNTMDENIAILEDLPTSVRGFVFTDENGDPVIVVNARLTREQNRRTWDHEQAHIARGDMFNEDYHEYEGGIP